MSLKHMHSRNTAKYAEQTVTRTPMGSILLSHAQVVIPIFQRPYCWTQSQLDIWFVDIFYSHIQLQIDRLWCTG